VRVDKALNFCKVLVHWLYTISAHYFSFHVIPSEYSLNTCWVSWEQNEKVARVYENRKPTSIFIHTHAHRPCHLA
jgi:hypothetical protein